MRTIIFITAIIIGANVAAQKFDLESKISAASWTGYGEIGSFKQEGTIPLKRGYIQVEAGKVQEGTIVFSARDIDHENKELRKHLKAKDFFYVNKYPEITYEIAGTYEDKVFGKLTIRGVTHEETFSFGKMEKEGLLIFEGEATVDRTKYDIKYNSSSYFQDLGNYAIKNEFDLRFKLVFKR